ncbi:protein FAM178B [Dromaius novaehollandiae]|uniref:protein FAM178B n=1 Tax=Dromaius novaehollandiae TaxID=8790 RepID=UPI00311E912A
MAPPGQGAAGPLGLRWYQLPLSSARAPRTGLFSPRFQASLQRYQQLRRLKHLRVGRPFSLPPPGLLPASPSPPPAAAPPPPPPCRDRPPPRRRRRRRRAAPRRAPASSRRPKEAPKGGAAQGGCSSPASPGCRLDGDRGRPASPEDGEEVLIPLRDLLLAGDEPRSPAESTRPDPLAGSLDPLANSLDSLVEEQRERGQATAPCGSPEWARGDATSPSESPDEDAPLSEEHRLFLARFAVKPGLIPAMHPGEPVFSARPLPPPALDARGLQPQSALEGLFLRASPASQAAFVREGHLSLLYRCAPACPLPVLRWLFQVSRVPPRRDTAAVGCPDTANASQALWEINVHRLSTGAEPWCPTVTEIGQVFCRLGADLGALHRQGLLPLELCPADRRPPDPPQRPGPAAPEATLALATQLGDICKLLALCVVARPSRYPDRARLALLTLLCFLGLDRALRCQPLPDLQHLLHCLLEGIGAWQEQLPDLCLSLCRLSQHHHNLVAVVRLLPDVTARGRELRRHLSLCIMARLLGEPLGTVLPGRAHAELQALCRLLALVQPAALQRLVLAECQNEPDDPDQEACYLSYSLLILASAVVGTERRRDEQRDHLKHLCSQLDRQLGAGFREGSGLLFRTQLKGLATLTYIKWQELLAQGPSWVRGTPGCCGPTLGGPGGRPSMEPSPHGAPSPQAQPCRGWPEL